MSNLPFNWPENAVSTLKQLWSDGSTATQIAEQIGHGLTRNSVLGKVHRLKLDKRKTSGTMTKAITTKARASRSGKGQPKVNAIVARVEAKQSLPMVVPFDIEDNPDATDVTHLVGLLALGRRSCRWPVTGEGAATLFCGEHADHGPYCPAHSERAGAGYCRGARP